MIRWEKANLSFKNRVLFRNMDLVINPGEKVIISNNSGSGKTTLLKTALGLIPLDSGQIFIQDIELKPANIDKIRNLIFYLDQDVTLPETEVKTLLDEIFLYSKNRNLLLDMGILYEHIAEFKLEKEILNKNIKELSGGERQRIGIIIGLLLQRPIWLLDEPTSALDKELKEIITSKISKLPITTIIISHDNCWNIFKTMTLECL